ncbi:DUF5789 family protein [Halorarum salinum]|uniref:DUF2795 domain-containing protein n=1 Tax=Halorarum salinum TaxID=2743089 RepID=A0A7D5QAY8_9EURY|nr:hypothetical protein [Halobaculum salinum]QLG62158.1 hypothetical protein HUG12_10605 [Halobaculum salinum]
MDRVRLSRVESRLDDLQYPISREDAAEHFADTTLTYADGEENLGDRILDCRSESFADLDELVSDLYNILPVEALGEPGQSEGDA